MLDGEAQRHGDLLEVHAYERAADVETGGGADVLDGDGVLHALPHGGGEGAAGLWLGDDADRLVAELLRRLALDYQRAVEVFAALGGEVEPVLLYERVEDVYKRQL